MFSVRVGFVAVISMFAIACNGSSSSSSDRNKSQLITWQRSCCCFVDGGRNVFSACWFRGSYFDVRDRMQRILVEFFTDARCAVTHGALVWIADDCCDSDWRRYARIECIQSQSRDRCCRLDGDVDEYRFDSAYVDLGRQRVELRNGRARTAVQFHVRLERHVSLPLRDSSGDGGDGDRPVKGLPPLPVLLENVVVGRAEVGGLRRAGYQSISRRCWQRR